MNTAKRWKRWMSAVMLMVGLTVPRPVAQAPGGAPKPGRVQKALGFFAGTWTQEGTMKSSPLGPGGAFTATETCEWFEGGFHLVCHSQGGGPMGPMRGHAIMTYDGPSKKYTYYAVSSNTPDAEYSSGTKNGAVWSFSSEIPAEGRTIASRFTMTEMSPTEFTFKWELIDGAKTTTVLEGRARKVK